MKIFEENGKMVVEGAEVQVVPLDTPALLVFRSTVSRSVAVRNLEDIKAALRDTLSPTRYRNLLVACASPETSFETFDEEAMRAHGWQRIPKE